MTGAHPRRPRFARWAALLAAALFGLIYACALGRGFTIDHLRNDGAQYLVTARHIQAGLGVRTDLQTYPAQQGGAPPVVQRVWPPMYPLALATLAELSGHALADVSVRLSLWCVFMIGALIWLIALDSGAGAVTAAILAGLWWALPMPILVAGGGQSESLFTLFLMAALLVLGWRGREPTAMGWAAASLAGAFFGLAFLTRYQGIAFVAVLGLFAIATLWQRRRLLPVLMAAALPMMVVAVQLLVNWLATGSARAGSTRRGEFVMGELLWQVQFGLRSAFGLDADWPTPAPAMLAIFCFLGWITGASLWRLARARLRARQLLPGPAGQDIHGSGGIASPLLAGPGRSGLAVVARWPLPLLAGALAAALLALHLALAVMASSTYPFEARYMEATVPLVLLAVAGIASGLRRPQEARLARGSRRILAGVMLACWALAIGAAWRDQGLPGSPAPLALNVAVRSALAGPVGARTLREWLRENTDAGSGLLAADGQVLGMLIERPVAALTEPAYSSITWTEERATELACASHARWLIVFERLLAGQAKGRDADDVIARLARGDTPAGWPTVHRSAEFRILEVCGAPSR
ncbi:MAG: hypothetical protein R3E83_11160 [Burkholderiaceae bacterium]